MKLSATFIAFGILGFAWQTAAQNKTVQKNISNDTTTPKTIVVTSSFKPELKESRKLQFSATTPAIDSGIRILDYHVPAQNLFFAYSPTALKPVSLVIDTTFSFKNTQYVKAGYGNYSTPYIQAGASFGNGKTSIMNALAEYTSSKGDLPFQKFNKAAAELNGVFQSTQNLEWSGKLYFNLQNQYQYGFQPDSLKFAEDDIQQQFTSFGIQAGFKNKKQNSSGVLWHPTIHINAFSDNHSANEASFIASLPFTKKINEHFEGSFSITEDFTNYKADTIASIDNNLFSMAPAIKYSNSFVQLNGGASFVWNGNDLNVLPNIGANIQVSNRLYLIAGWNGYFEKRNYKNLANINPWLRQPAFLKNTKTIEQYAGFKGTAGKQVNYLAKISYSKLKNEPLFINDSFSGKSFFILNESSMDVVSIHGEVSYNLPNKLSLLGGITFNQYSNLSNNEEAWGMLPLELKGSLQWQIWKDILLKSDLYFFDGAKYKNKDGSIRNLDAAFDLNAGVEAKIFSRTHFWLQINNVFNNKYERWNQYEVLGLQVVAGLVYSFH